MKHRALKSLVLTAFTILCALISAVYYNRTIVSSKARIPETPANAARTSETMAVDLDRCYDGDTCTFFTLPNRLKLRVRLVGVDTPELPRKGSQGQPYAQEARLATESLLQGGEVTMVSYGLDAYNRVLGEIWVQESEQAEPLLVNREIVRLGLAWVYDRAPKNLDLLSYKHAESEAKQKRLGVWESPGHAQTAVEYRRKERKKKH